MKKALPPLLIALVLSLVGCGKAEQAAAPTSVQAPPAAKAVELYQLDKQFDALMSFLLNDEVSSFSRGDDSTLAAYLGLVDTPAKSLAKTYSDNQVAGDQQFFKKKLLVTGKLASINSGLGNEPYLVFRDTGFLGVQAHLAKGLAAESATLKKNQDVALVCVGNGSIAGVPMLADCQFASAVGLDGARQLGKEIEAFAKGKDSTPTAVWFSVMVEAMARMADDAVDCSDGCLKQWDMKKLKTTENLSSIIAKMKEGGLKVDFATEERLTKPASTAK